MSEDSKEKKDLFISYKNTDHDNPYDDPQFLKIEEISCFIMAYKKPYSRGTVKSLKNYRGRLRKRCKGCSRLPDNCEIYEDTEFPIPAIIHNGDVKVPNRIGKVKQWVDSCRVYLLKTRLTKEIRGPVVNIRGGTARITID